MAMWNERNDTAIKPTEASNKFSLVVTSSALAIFFSAQPAYSQVKRADAEAIMLAQATPPADPADAVSRTPGMTPPPPGTVASGVPGSASEAGGTTGSVKSDSGGEIVITGSLIARPDYKSDSPIVSLSNDVIANSGQTTVEHALSALPQFSGSFGQGNTSSTGTGLNGGQSYASLRGLGSKRTLLLLDGKRLQPSNPDGSVDLNIIPDQLIGNVEVITGGASTAYGSDATAGVVNFRLKRDLRGLLLKTDVGTTTYGDGNQYRVNLSAGGKFNEDRGSYLFSMDYTQRNRAKRIERPWYTNRVMQSGNTADANGEAIFSSNSPTVASVNGVLAKYGAGQLTGSGRYTAMVGFNTNSTIFTINGAPALHFLEPSTDDAYLVTVSPTGTYGPNQQLRFNFLGGDLQSNMKRYSAFGRFDYDLTDNIQAYGQFSYVTYKQNAIVNTTLTNNIYTQTVPVANPFLPADLQTILASRTNPTADFQFQKAYNAIGNRGQGYKYDVWQFMVGLQGKLNIKDWTWEVYGSQSKSQFLNTQTGALSKTRVNQLVYAADGGKSLCTGGLNLFGNFPISPSCAAFIEVNLQNTVNLNQRIVSGQLQGGVFDLPYGEVRFALGSDYRYNSFSYRPDGRLDQPDGTSDVLGFAALRHNSGSVNTKEIFGELLVPLLKDLPAVRELNLDLGYRYSKYNTVGGVSTYKADLDWQVFGPVRLRGGYNRAIRAPSVGELFAPVSSSSTGIGNPSSTTLTGDPCDSRSSFSKGANKAQVRALCIAQGMTSDIYDHGFTGVNQVFPLTGGNPNLKQETADTYSIGAVLTSPLEEPLLHNIQLSVDYYNIKIKGAVGTLGIGTSLQYCFNAGGNNPSYDVNNLYCQNIKRDAQGALSGNSVQPLLNLGTFQVSGIDIQVDWKGNLENFGLPANSGALSLRSVISYLDHYKVQSIPGAPTYDYAGTIGFQVDTASASGVSHPRWKAITSLAYTIGKASAGLTWHYIGGQEYDTTGPVQPGFAAKAYNLFDLNLRYELPWGIDAHLAVNNLFNKAPPPYGTTIETYDAGTYDVVGRSFLISLSKKF